MKNTYSINVIKIMYLSLCFVTQIATGDEILEPVLTVVNWNSHPVYDGNSPLLKMCHAAC